MGLPSTMPMTRLILNGSTILLPSATPMMDRCGDKWYLTIDCDEWLDADISGLVALLNGKSVILPL